MLADLHLHSKYSRATSKNLDLENLEKYARLKGIELLGTGDFTHPKWFEELKRLDDDGTGLLKSSSGFPFALTSEISLIYRQQDKGRRIHVVMMAPDLGTVEQIRDYLLTKGRLDYDGRPIFNIPCPELVESLRKISPKIEVFPAHIWTPWFSMFGSMSGFDTVKDCFQDQEKHINAIETGLSSDPPMNWRLSQLDRYSIVSFSDSHSFWPWRIGREATAFRMKKQDYASLLSSLRGNELDYTVEVDPSYGKYHFDGHRNCKVRMSPDATKKAKGMCPVCKRPVTVGVLGRVEELADRPEGYIDKSRPGFKTLLPLSELIAFAKGTSPATKKVWATYHELLKGFGSEFNIMLRAPEDELAKVSGKELAELLIRNREGKIKVAPGYDGEYGVPVMNGVELKDHEPEKGPQKTMDDFS